MNKTFLYILVGLLLVAVGVAYFLNMNNTNQPSPVPNVQSESDSEEFTENSDPKNLFKNFGPAPEFSGIEKWLNNDPLTIKQLQDKVVLINFWTYSDINSIRTLPYLIKWYQDYKDQGLVVIGVHTPEFAFEKVTINVEAAIKKYALSYPVAQDNNYKTWTAYHNQFWPAHYLIDKDGNIVYTHFGEGKYEQTEKAIRTLLGLEGDFQIPEAPPANQAKTPEIYFGLSRLEAFGGTEKPNNGPQIFTFPSKLKANQFALEGSWEFNQEAAVHNKGFGRIKLNFNAAKVFMVAQSPKPTTIRVFVDGKLIKGVVVSNSDLYELFDSLSGSSHTMEIEIPNEGFEAFTFTFG